MVERFNSTILKMCVDDHQTGWDRHVPQFLLSYHSFMHETTRQTLANIVFGQELRLK